MDGPRLTDRTSAGLARWATAFQAWRAHEEQRALDERRAAKAEAVRRKAERKRMKDEAIGRSRAALARGPRQRALDAAAPVPATAP